MIVEKVKRFLFPIDLQAAERLVLSDGELKMQFESFRKAPEISGNWLLVSS